MSNLAPNLDVNGTAPDVAVFTVKSWTAAEAAFSINGFLESITETPPFGGTTTINDILYNQQTGATVRVDGQVSTDLPPSDPPEYESLNPSIGTVAQNGYVSWVSNGTCRVLAKRMQGWRAVNLALSRTSGVTINTFNSYVAGSLSKHAVDAIDGKITGVIVNDTNKKIFSSIAAGAPVSATRSTDFWAKDIDWTCLSPGNSQGYNQNCVALSSDIVAYAGHYPLTTGCTIYFFGPDGTMYSRTLTADNDILTLAGVAYVDVRLGRLDSPLPAAITPATVLPSNWRNYLPSIKITNTGGTVPTLPLIYTDKESKALVREMYYYQAEDLVNQTSAYNTARQGQSTLRSAWYETSQGGDSNGGVFLPVNNKLTWMGVVSESPTAPQTYLTQLNAMVAALHSSNPILTTDLSGFNTY